MKQTEGNKSVEVVMPGAFGPRSIGIDEADVSSRAYATDWFNVFALPARPSVFCLDIASGILAGSLITQICIFVGFVHGPFYGIAISALVLGGILFVANWVLRVASPWEKLGVGYRLCCLVIGSLIIALSIL